MSRMRVQIVSLKPGDDKGLLSRTGTIRSIIDGKLCIVALDGGGQVHIDIKHLNLILDGGRQVPFDMKFFKPI